MRGKAIAAPLLGAVLCLGASSGRAGDYTLHETGVMAQLCRNALALQEAPGSLAVGTDKHRIAYVNCFAYIAGFSAGLIKGSSVEFVGHPGTFCARTPGESTYAQKAAVFVRWANNNPHLWHLPLNATMMMAFAEAWPCR
jgi:Rap1a immunity proteins